MSYVYTSRPINDLENQRNKENAMRAMSSTSRISDEKAEMRLSYASAEKEYKEGNIEAGDKKVEEGRAAAEKAKREIGDEANKKAEEYCNQSAEAYGKGDMEKKKEYDEKADKVMSDAQKEKNGIDLERKQAEERALAERKSETRSRT